MAIVKDILSALGEMYPWELALEDDNCGLQVGDPRCETRGIVCSVGIDHGCIDFAGQNGCNLVVSHHPLIYSPLSSIDRSTSTGSLLCLAQRSELNVVSCHTNADIAVGGTADLLAGLIGLTRLRPLVHCSEVSYLKLVVFVPPEALDDVVSAMAEAGAGKLGNYSHCTFRVEGEGTFLPLDGASPYSGKVGDLSRVKEIRLETILASFLKSRVLEAALGAHPYEEVAYDLYPLENPVPWGLGRVGEFEEEQRIEKVKSEVLKQTKTRVFREALAEGKMLRRVAVGPGSANSLVEPAVGAGADLLVCGEISYHRALQAVENGMSVSCLGHLESERPLIRDIKEGLNHVAEISGWDFPILEYLGERSPWEAK